MEFNNSVIEAFLVVLGIGMFCLPIILTGGYGLLSFIGSKKKRDKFSAYLFRMNLESKGNPFGMWRFANNL